MNFQKFFRNLSLVNLDIVILEYDHNVSFYMVVEEIKIYKLITNNIKHDRNITITAIMIQS